METVSHEKCLFCSLQQQQKQHYVGGTHDDIWRGAEHSDEKFCAWAFVLLRVFHRINIIFQCLNKKQASGIRNGGILSQGWTRTQTWDCDGDSLYPKKLLRFNSKDVPKHCTNHSQLTSARSQVGIRRNVMGGKFVLLWEKFRCRTRVGNWTTFPSFSSIPRSIRCLPITNSVVV